MQNKRLKPIVGVIITLLLIEFVLRKLNNRTYRVIVLVVIILLFLLLWIELAVGIFGSPIAGS